MRIPPEQRIVCHVCGARYVQRNDVAFVDHVPEVTSSPDLCPRCDAPPRRMPTIDVGMAKDLLLLLVGAPVYVQTFHSLPEFLVHRCPTAAQLDALLARVHALDLAAWERDAAARAGTDPERLAELRDIRKLRAAFAGPLQDHLHATVDAHRTELASARARHLAIAASRKGQPRDAW